MSARIHLEVQQRLVAVLVFAVARETMDVIGNRPATRAYFNDPVTRMYVTTAKPGHLDIFDVSGDLANPKLLKSLLTGEGAHHVAFTKDWKLAFVQNTLLNLPGMSEGNVTVVDLENETVVAQIDTLQKAGFNPNLIVLLPEWNSLAGH